MYRSLNTFNSLRRDFRFTFHYSQICILMSHVKISCSGLEDSKLLVLISILSTSRIKPIFKEISFITWQKIQFYVNLTWNRNNTFSFGLWAEIKSILANLLNKKNSILREFHVKSWNFFNLLSKIAIILLISA